MRTIKLININFLHKSSKLVISLVRDLQILLTISDEMLIIQFLTNTFDSALFQSIFLPLALWVIVCFNFEKYRSMGASSGLYWGINITLKPSFSRYAFTQSERCIDALSNIIKQFSGSSCSLSSINFTNSFKKSIKILEFIHPVDLASTTPPVVEIAVIKKQEFLKQIFLIICSLPLGIQEKFFFVNLVKDDLSMLMSRSDFSKSLHTLISNHCFIRSWRSSSKLTNLESPFLYLIFNTFIIIFLTFLSGYKSLTLAFMWAVKSFEVHGVFVVSKYALMTFCIIGDSTIFLFVIGFSSKVLFKGEPNTFLMLCNVPIHRL